MKVLLDDEILALLPMLKDSTSRMRAAELIKSSSADFDGLMKQISMHRAPTAEASLQDQPWLGWAVPAFGWLVRGEWIEVSELRDAYNNAAEYAEVLQRISTLMTFYWGAGTLFFLKERRATNWPIGLVVA